MARYKQRCFVCKKNMVIVTPKTKFPVCYDCQKNDLNVEIKNKKMKEMFDIPEEFYKESLFLRSIKLSYIRFGKLSAKQIEWFKKVVEEMKKTKQ
jgi:hypothetical protein